MEIRICPRCHGRSHNPDSEICWHCEDRVREPRRLSKAAHALIESIPDRFRWATLKSLEITLRVQGGVRTVTFAKKTIDEQKHIVLLAGEAGTGKTSLGCAMLRAWQEKTRATALFVSSTELTNARLQHALGKGEVDLVDRCNKTHLLLIDDLGAETRSPRAEITDVIQRRHNYNLPTWFTTALHGDEIEARYGAGIARRIQEESTLFDLNKVCGA